MKIVMSSRGSRGDVNPIIEIAAGLINSGHNVSLCVPGLFREYSQNRGLNPSFYTEDSEQVMKGMGSGLKAIRSALDWFSKSVEEQFEFMLKETEDADIMANSVNEIAAPTVAEYRKLPFYRIAYTPVLPGYQPPPLIPWQKLPGKMNRAMWGIVNSLTGVFIKRFLNSKRQELGLEPLRSVGRYFTERSHTILSINPQLAPPCNSWKENYCYSYTGYCYGNIEGELAPELEAFLATGPPPLYIGFGSVSVKDPERFTAIVIAAVKHAGCRVILGSGWTGLGSFDLPQNIFRVSDTFHGTLFPRCAGIAHHGGSGTTHTAARAGVPQFIMPQLADQFYWGNRVHSIGLGPAPVTPGKITETKLAIILKDLCNNNTYRNNARRLAQDMANDNGIEEIIEILTSPAN